MKFIKKLISKRACVSLYNFLVICIAILAGLFIKKNKNYKDIWLIGERNNEARDNGYHLFKYIRTNHPYIKAYYVIDTKAIDKKKIEQYGNLINFGSFKHFLYYTLCKKHISTHIDGTAPDNIVCPLIKKYIFSDKKNIFLQHGVIKDNLPLLHSQKTNLDIFVCGAKPEFDFIIENFGYTNGEVKYLGLARFDNLHDYTVKRQILLMPTFRMWLWTPSKVKSNDECKEFLKSNYYREYQSLINNKKIAELLFENNVELVFYPHYEAQKYLHLFSSKYNNITIANKDDYDVQQLLKESALLITDYSSVYFDFGYMRKPVVYYQFDNDEYRSKHYEKGYFSYSNDGFGPIVDNEEGLCNELDNIIREKFIINTKYRKRIEVFFPLYDNQNVKRNFDAIFNL